MDIIKKAVNKRALLLLAVSALLPFTLIAQTDSNTDNTAQSESQAGSASNSIVTRGVLVRQTDSWGSIARKELGRAAFAPLLAEFNNSEVNERPEAGSVVRIPVPAPESDEFAQVVFVKGEASLVRQSVFGNQSGNPDENLTTSELTRESKIVSGDTISTQGDGYVSIEFFSGAVINLQPNTSALLERLSCQETDASCLVEINTQRGRVSADINARDQQPLEFRIITPYASAAVRGTVFDVSADEQLLVGVTDGGVAVTAQGENLDLDIGFGVAVAEGQTAGDPIELSPAPVFRRIPARIAIGDTLAWWQLVGSSAYEATVSLDEGAREIHTSFNVPGRELELDLQQALDQSLAAGDYFLTMRAIDTTGLLGFRSRTRITLADIDPSITPVNTAVVRDGGDFLVSVIDAPEDAPGYEIQVSADSAFSDPLSVDINEDGRAIFRLDQDQVYTRARVLLNPTTVSAFGEISTN